MKKSPPQTPTHIYAHTHLHAHPIPTLKLCTPVTHSTHTTLIGSRKPVLRSFSKQVLAVCTVNQAPKTNPDFSGMGDDTAKLLRWVQAVLVHQFLPINTSPSLWVPRQCHSASYFLSNSGGSESGSCLHLGLPSCLGMPQSPPLSPPLCCFFHL